jgi:hypothetical protein
LFIDLGAIALPVKGVRILTWKEVFPTLDDLKKHHEGWKFEEFETHYCFTDPIEDRWIYMYYFTGSKVVVDGHWVVNLKTSNTVANHSIPHIPDMPSDSD